MFENILWAKAVEKTGATSLDIVEKMIQYQHTLLSNTLLALVAIAGLIAAASLAYNIYISRKKLEDIKEDITSELTVKAEKIIDAKLKKSEEKITKDFQKETARIRGGIYATAAEIFSARQDHVAVAISYAGAAKNSNILKLYDDARSELGLVIRFLSICESIEQGDKDLIKKHISSIHESLNHEKKEIEKILHKLPIKKE